MKQTTTAGQRLIAALREQAAAAGGSVA